MGATAIPIRKESDTKTEIRSSLWEKVLIFLKWDHAKRVETRNVDLMGAV